MTDRICMHPVRAAGQAAWRWVVTERELFEQQLFDRLERGDFAMIELADTAVDHLERTGHFQTNHAGLDPVEQRSGGSGRSKLIRRLPWQAGDQPLHRCGAAATGRGHHRRQAVSAPGLCAWSIADVRLA